MVRDLHWAYARCCKCRFAQWLAACVTYNSTHYCLHIAEEPRYPKWGPSRVPPKNGKALHRGWAEHPPRSSWDRSEMEKSELNGDESRQARIVERAPGALPAGVTKLSCTRTKFF